jgi:hypothetical protein
MLLLFASGQADYSSSYSLQVSDKNQRLIDIQEDPQSGHSSWMPDKVCLHHHKSRTATPKEMLSQSIWFTYWVWKLQKECISTDSVHFLLLSWHRLPRLFCLRFSCESNGVALRSNMMSLHANPLLTSADCLLQTPSSSILLLLTSCLYHSPSFDFSCVKERERIFQLSWYVVTLGCIIPFFRCILTWDILAVTVTCPSFVSMECA